MAGTITISTLSDGTNSTSATNPIKGSAKAWCAFYGSGVQTITQSYNVSSITLISTGLYQIAYTTAFANGNNIAVGSLSQIGGVGYAFQPYSDEVNSANTNTTNYVQMVVAIRGAGSFNATLPSQVYAAVFGN